MGSDLYTAGKTSARRRLLQVGQAVSESELIIVLLNGEVHFVQPSTGEFLSLLWLFAYHPCLTDTVVQRAPLVVKGRHDVSD